MMSPMHSSGAVISTAMIGSRIVGPALSIASLNASEPAILNAISEESTLWYLPSISVTRKSTTGLPDSQPRSAASRMPFSTAGR